MRAMDAGRMRIGLDRPDLVWVLVGVMAVVGLNLGGLMASSSAGAAGPLTGALHIQLPWWLLAVGFYVAGSRAVHLQFQREAHSFTLSEIPLVAGLFLAAPGDIVLASVIGSGAALIIHRRPAPVKLAFNLSLYLLGSAVAVSLFRLIAGSASPLVPSTWLAAFLAVGASTIIGLAAVNAAIWLAQGRSDRRRLALAVRFGLAVALTNSCLALIAVTLAHAAPGAPWLLVVPLVLVGMAWLSYRAHIGEREQRDSLQLLYSTTRILHSGTELEAAIVALLRDARRTFRAEFAELTLFTAEGHRSGLRTTLGPDDRIEVMAAVRLAAGADDLRLRTARDRASFLAPALSGKAARTDRIGGAPVRDAMVAPLIGERSLIGTFVMANRQGALGTFRPAELQLFETLANHAGVALENGRLGRSLKDLSELKEQLSHQALHDSLTGLGNRDQFIERLTSALDRHGHGGPSPAVIFIDLDDFKAVNDSLGHAGGDRLLRASAAAISHGLRPSDLAVRLAGDEFAVLVDDGRDLASVSRIAERIIEAIARPVEIDGRWISASASVGIAGTRGRSQNAAELMSDADVAMYAAKSDGKGCFAVFDP
ncbi:MAG: sensor domain-containing diguanylate cyclase, partial [Chloroflexota bacterium]|nr:sensor domain-containing diguanylate cyclase [Chloroflexota bacterium]